MEASSNMYPDKQLPNLKNLIMHSASPTKLLHRKVDTAKKRRVFLLQLHTRKERSIHHTVNDLLSDLHCLKSYEHYVIKQQFIRPLTIKQTPCPNCNLSENKKHGLNANVNTEVQYN